MEGKRFLHPALGVACELGAQRGGEKAEDDDGNVSRSRVPG